MICEAPAASQELCFQGLPGTLQGSWPQPHAPSSTPARPCCGGAQTHRRSEKGQDPPSGSKKPDEVEEREEAGEHFSLWAQRSSHWVESRLRRHGEGSHSMPGIWTNILQLLVYWPLPLLTLIPLLTQMPPSLWLLPPLLLSRGPECPRDASNRASPAASHFLDICSSLPPTPPPRDPRHHLYCPMESSASHVLLTTPPTLLMPHLPLGLLEPDFCS